MTVCALVHMSGGTPPEDPPAAPGGDGGAATTAHPPVGDARRAGEPVKRYSIREKLHGATDRRARAYGVALAGARGTRSAWRGEFVAGIMRGAEDAQDPDAGDAEEPRDVKTRSTGKLIVLLKIG